MDNARKSWGRVSISHMTWYERTGHKSKKLFQKSKKQRNAFTAWPTPTHCNLNQENCGLWLWVMCGTRSPRPQMRLLPISISNPTPAFSFVCRAQCFHSYLRIYHMHGGFRVIHHLLEINSICPNGQFFPYFLPSIKSLDFAELVVVGDDGSPWSDSKVIGN